MVDVRGDVLRPPHGTTPAVVKANKIQKLSSFKSNENIHKREDGSYYVVSQVSSNVSCKLLQACCKSCCHLDRLVVIQNHRWYCLRFVRFV